MGSNSHGEQQPGYRNEFIEDLASPETCLRLSEQIIKKLITVGQRTPNSIMGDVQADGESVDECGQVVPVILFGYNQIESDIICRADISTYHTENSYIRTEYRFVDNGENIGSEKHKFLILDDGGDADGHCVAWSVLVQSSEPEERPMADERPIDEGQHAVTERDLSTLEQIIDRATFYDKDQGVFDICG